MEFSGGSPSLYRVLGVCLYSSDEEIRRAYLKLAMQWHPDKWARNPSLLGEAKQKFQKIQEAYSVLSDRKRRRLYDAGLYGLDIEEEEEYEVEGFSDFLQEMVSLINDARKEVLRNVFVRLSNPPKRSNYSSILFVHSFRFPIPLIQGWIYIWRLEGAIFSLNSARMSKKIYTPKELQSMFWDMARGFGIPECYDTQNTQKPVCEPQWLHGKINDKETGKKRMRSALKI